MIHALLAHSGGRRAGPDKRGRRRWLTVAAPGDTAHELPLAAVDYHVSPLDRDAMRDLVAKGELAVLPEALT